MDTLQARQHAYYKEEFILPNMGMSLYMKAMRLRTIRTYPDWSYPDHEHTPFEIHLLINGNQRVMVEGKEYLQKAGDVLLIQPGMRHSFMRATAKELTHFFLLFDLNDDTFLPLLQSVDEVLFSADSLVAQTIRPALDKMAELAKRDDPKQIAERLMVYSATFELFAGLSESLNVLSRTKSPSVQRVEQLAREIAECIQRAARKSITYDSQIVRTRTGIREIIKEIGVSASHGHRVFQRVYGISPRQYLSELMLAEAQRLLQSDMQIEHIATLLGYRDPSHFSQQFKRWTGQSPSRFRQSQSD